MSINRFHLSLAAIFFPIAHYGYATDLHTADAIYKKTSPAVVVIYSDNGDGTISQGSGFITNPNCYIVTNAHVVASAVAIIIKDIDGEKDRSEILKIDYTRDIAILRTPKHLLKRTGLRLLTNYKPVVGAWTCLIGSPKGLEFTLTVGVVSQVRKNQLTPQITRTEIQTDASASPGSSGGPLLNEYGNIIGMLTYHVREGANLNFSVSAADIKTVLTGKPEDYKPDKSAAKIVRIDPPEKTPPIAIPPAGTETVSGVVQSSIVGTVKQYEQGMIFELKNGQIWKQTEAKTGNTYQANPDVIIFPEGGVYRMKIEGIDETIEVIKLK